MTSILMFGGTSVDPLLSRRYSPDSTAAKTNCMEDSKKGKCMRFMISLVDVMVTTAVLYQTTVSTATMRPFRHFL